MTTSAYVQLEHLKNAIRQQRRADSEISRLNNNYKFKTPAMKSDLQNWHRQRGAAEDIINSILSLPTPKE